MKKPLLLAVVAAIALVIGLAIAPAVKTGATAPDPGSVTYRTDVANGTFVNVNLTAEETVQEIAPGVKFDVWTFDGTAPGPVIRVHPGDTIHFSLTNASSIGMQHSIDFHAAMTPWADLPAAGADVLTGNYQPVNPGETKTFDWVAMYPGVFMYHCGASPVLEHIANGMYGAIIVEPENLPPEREFVLVASEFYPSDDPVRGAYVGDLNKMLAIDPGYVVFNGVADQYKVNPLEVAPGEPFRLWVLNAGPSLTNAFHVIGTMFDETHDSGNPANTAYGLQTFNIAPGSGAMFELRIPDPGLYPFVTHTFAYTGLGSVGLIKVDPAAPAPPSTYPTLGNPFDGGLTPFHVTEGPPPSATPTATVPPAQPADCRPHGSELPISARSMKFSTACLAARADTPFTIAFDNQDLGVPHNVSIYSDDTASTSQFTGDLVTGPKKMTYAVPALASGTYFFRCDVHPTTMSGTFVVT